MSCGVLCRTVHSQGRGAKQGSGHKRAHMHGKRREHFRPRGGANSGGSGVRNSYQMLPQDEVRGFYISHHNECFLFVKMIHFWYMFWHQSTLYFQSIAFKHRSFQGQGPALSNTSYVRQGLFGDDLSFGSCHDVHKVEVSVAHFFDG